MTTDGLLQLESLERQCDASTLPLSDATTSTPNERNVVSPLLADSSKGKRIPHYLKLLPRLALSLRNATLLFLLYPIVRKRKAVEPELSKSSFQV